MARSEIDYPKNLRWQILPRQMLINQIVALVGAVAMHATEVMNGQNLRVLGLPYQLVWTQCLGLYGLLFIGPGMIAVARRGWRNTVDAPAKYARLGVIRSLPPMVRLQVLAMVLTGMALAAWVARQTMGWLVHAVDVAWLPPVIPPFDLTLFFTAYGATLVGVHEYFWERATLSELREHKAQQLSDQAQLNLLRSQLDPHMLFNTLSNLYELIDESPAQARSMLSHLIGFLRSTLAGSRANQHALVDEFKLASDYLALMQIRMGERLRVTLSLQSALEILMVPAMLLQPLVENAIKHGLEPCKEGGQLSITALAESGDLVLQVNNSGLGLDSNARTQALAPGALPAPAPNLGSGFGLHFVRNRLNTLYGQAASLDLRPLPAGTPTPVLAATPL